MRRFICLLTVFLALGLGAARAAHTQVTLRLSTDAARPGDTVLAGFDLKMEPGWHTYWKNAGESGIPTEIKWTLPPGVTAGEIQWPLPHKLPPVEVTTYGYLDETMLIVPLTLSRDLKPGQTLDLQANLTWLECEDECIPGKDTVSAKLVVASETKASAAAETIAAWQKQVPGSVTNSGWSVQAYWEKPPNGDSRPLIIAGVYQGEQSKPLQVTAADLFPAGSDDFEIEPAAELMPGDTGGFRMRKIVKKLSNWPKTAAGALVLDSTLGKQAYEVQMAIAEQPAPNNLGTVGMASPNGTQAAAAAAAPQNQGGAGHSFLGIIAAAFLGGLILNIMPCVLPVIALKIFGFVSEAQSQPARVRNLGLVYAAGVLASFTVLASVVIGIKAAGHAAGWGMQFGSPVFVVTLTTLVLLVALNLFGIFEVTLGGRAMDSAGELAAKHGYAGAFFNGALATTLATPCTAPGLGYAVGWAFSQPAWVILLIFLVSGLGLAAPYVALSWNPAWLKFLPKPGAWMEKFKIAMGFPMLLTVVWLFNLAYGDYGSQVLYLGIFLVLVAFAAWIYGEFVQRGRRNQALAGAIAAGLLIGGYAYALEYKLQWREMAPGTDAASGPRKEGADGIEWGKWSPEAVAAAQAAGHPVLVDFTADWCLTCQVNKKTSIEIPSVRSKLKELNAVALLADYTHAPENITVELSRHGRAGVPMVLVFPKTAGAAPEVLPEVLTPGIVLTALGNAAK